MARLHGAKNKTPDQLRQEAQRLLDRADHLDQRNAPDYASFYDPEEVAEDDGDLLS